MKSAARMFLACPARNARQVWPDRVGAGSMPALSRIRHTVDGAILYPRPVSSPWMRWLCRVRHNSCTPQPLFSVASRSISAVSSALVGGRPVTSRCIRRLLGKGLISAVKTAGRSSSARAGDGCGAARRPRAAAPAAPRSWRPLSDRAGQASRRAGRRSGRAGEGKRQIIMLHGCPFAHRRSSQARQTLTPQPPQLIENLLDSPRRSTDCLNLPIQGGSSCKQPQGPCWRLGARGGIEEATCCLALLHQAPPPRETRLSTWSVSLPLPFPNSTSVPSPPMLR